jgi:acetyl esterase/lipase
VTVTIRRDVVHTQVDGYRPLSLDLYLGPAPRALCVYAHGGGWRRGSRRAGPGPLSPTSGRLFERMAAAGLAVASVDYRLSGEARFPAQQHDVAAAFAWLAQHVPDLPRVTFGVSAGGQLAALAALDASLDVRACALWYPVTDLRQVPADIEAAGGAPDLGPQSREALLLGGTAASKPALAEAASPAAQVHAAAPPFLLLHGDADDLVPTRQSVRLYDALLAVDGQPVLESVPGYGHMFAGMPDAEVDGLVDRTASYLLEQAGEK